MVEILREHVACSHSRIMESSITVVQIRTATSCGVLLREIMTPTKNGVTAKVSLLLTFIANIISEAKKGTGWFQRNLFLSQTVNEDKTPIKRGSASSLADPNLRFIFKRFGS